MNLDQPSCVSLRRHSTHAFAACMHCMCSNKSLVANTWLHTCCMLSHQLGHCKRGQGEDDWFFVPCGRACSIWPAAPSSTATACACQVADKLGPGLLLSELPMPGSLVPGSCSASSQCQEAWSRALAQRAPNATGHEVPLPFQDRGSVASGLSSRAWLHFPGGGTTCPRVRRMHTR